MKPEKLQDENQFLCKIITAGIILSFIIQLILYLKGYFSFSGDESDRTLLAYSWFINDMPEGEPWLPFHTIINGLLFHLYFDLFLIPRITGTIFCMLSVGSFIWFSHLLIRERSVTIISAVIAVFFPPFLILRAVPLTEVMYFFFIITASAFLYKWISEKQHKYIFFSSIFFALSTSVRYEGWIFAGSLIIFLFLKHFSGNKLKINIVLISSAILLAFPLFWVVKNAADTGNLLAFIQSSSERYKVRYGFSLLPMLKYNLVTQFIYQNIIYLNFGGFVSLVFFLFTDKNTRNWSITPLLAFIIVAVLSFLGLAMPSHAYWRIPLIWNIFLIPFTAHFLIKFSAFISDIISRKKKFVLVSVTLLIVIYFIFQVNRIISFSYFSEDDIAAGKFLEEKINQENNPGILIDTYDWNYLNVIVASNNPGNFNINVKKDPLKKEEPILSSEKEINFALLKNEGIEYLLFESVKMKEFLNKRSGLIRVKKFGEWELYKVK